MRLFILKLSILIALPFSLFNPSIDTQEFQGKAYYFSKSRMDLGTWGSRMSEAQKKQIQSRLKGRLEKTYILSFNKE